jgi:FemAB-related protein (PEP-CTERM system-associated)
VGSLAISSIGADAGLSACRAQIDCLCEGALNDALPAAVRYRAAAKAPLSAHPNWLQVLAAGLSQHPYLLLARQSGEIAGQLPLVFMRSLVFGKFLVSLPYINSAGVAADSAETEAALIDRAVELADELDVRYLELRHETARQHPALTRQLTSKVHMRLALPSTVDELWNGLHSKVRNQIRKGQQHDLVVRWGGRDRLADFYAVFSRNMRDLGTPVFSRRLFEGMLESFPGECEICTVQQGPLPIAGAILVHGQGRTEVPSASSLRTHNATNANMLMYWHLLQRAVERRQPCFDFGRSTEGSNTYRFKAQWGARPCPAVWQYYVRRGDVGEMRPDNARYARLVRIWQRLPVPLTRLIGPPIVRGIP